MWQNIKQIILKLFNKSPTEGNREFDIKNRFAKAYMSLADINFTAIFSNKLASLAVTESNVNVTGVDGRANRRAELLDGLLQDVWSRARGITAQALGTGGVVLIPYSVGGKIYTDVVAQNRLFVSEMSGDEIRSATIISDIITRNSIEYCRLTDYSLENNTYVIRNRATRSGSPASLDSIPEWANIPDEIRIANVDRILFAYLRCPVDNRNNDRYAGVPITFGSEKILSDIKECLEQIRREFDLKQVFVGADDTLFTAPQEGPNKGNQRLPKNGLYHLLSGSSDGNEFWQVFDPAIRDSSYFNRLQHLFELLEKSVGVSKGVLTEPLTTGATATEIKRANYDTYATVESIRKQWQAALNDLVYSFDVLANFYSLTPPGEYQISCDWDYTMIESSQESWQQLRDGQSIGVVKKAEARQFLFPSETLDEAQAAVDEITENEPDMATLFGGE